MVKCIKTKRGMLNCNIFQINTKLRKQETQNQLTPIVNPNTNDTRVRPIVVKFHSYKDREMVREQAYTKRDSLREMRLSVREQWPRSVIDKRQSLYPIMSQERAKGKVVKLIRDKLYINGHLYTPSVQE